MAIQVKRYFNDQRYPIDVSESFGKEITLTNKKKIIPLEIFFNVISFLENPQDLVSASKVCRSWNWVFHDDALWNILSHKYLLKSREEFLRKIANTMGNNDSQRNDVYQGLLKEYNIEKYADFKNDFFKIIERISFKKAFIYNYFLEKIKKENNRSKEDFNLTSKYENYAAKLILFYIGDPKSIMYFNSVNYSGFTMTLEKMDDNLETFIKSAFSDAGAAIFTIVKEEAIISGRIHSGSTISGQKLALPKYKLVSSYEPLKKALEIYISQMRHSRKRHAPSSD
jgi:hypothetical protein